MTRRIPVRFLTAVAVLAASAVMIAVLKSPKAAHLFLYLAGVVILLAVGFVKIFAPRGISNDRIRLQFFILSTLSMFVPFACWLCWVDIVSHLGPGTGLPLPEIPGFWFQTVFWSGLAVLSPFFAAWYLRLAKRPNRNAVDSRELASLTYAGDRPSSPSYHVGRKGHPPVTGINADHSLANLSCYRWQKHCRGLYQTPMAA